jgi:tetratricopeptide (TPR) repeat protein
LNFAADLFTLLSFKKSAGMMSVPFTDFKAAKTSTSWLICVLLVLSVIAVYCPALNFAFIDYDDGDYILNNPQVMRGLSWSGVAWAFTHFCASNWHPLTWLSHMLDVQLYGLNAGGHHATNVLFHAANTVLLFLWLRRATDFVWRSTLVAALFGLHPLHVESVAWVAERKDVLSTFFFLLTLMAYTRYVQKPEFRSQKSELHLAIFNSFFLSPFYWLALFCFALGLMSKPMLVTLPFVLLLLDYWPLNRIGNSESGVRNLKMVLVEKAPFFVLSAGSCVLTFLAQQAGKAMMSTTVFPIGARIENAQISYALYLEKMFWPDNLAAYYPLYNPIATDELILAVFVLLLVTGVVIILRRQRPYLVTGWLWYLGTLLPVIGLLQVGGQAMADRYTYVPLIGVFIALTWLLAEVSRTWVFRRLLLAVLSAGVLAVCGNLTATQVRYWQDSETVARHALAVTTDNNAQMQVLLGNTLTDQGKIKEAGEHFAEAVKDVPTFIQARRDLVLSLVAQGRLDEAVDICRTGLNLQPGDVKSHYILINLYSMQGKGTEAVAEYNEVLRDEPEELLNLNNLACLNNLAWLLATAPDASVRNGTEAVRLAEKACRLTNYERPVLMGTLAAAYAEAGRFDEAITTAQKAVALATAAKNEGLIKKNRDMLELYQHQKAYHQPVSH